MWGFICFLFLRFGVFWVLWKGVISFVGFSIRGNIFDMGGGCWGYGVGEVSRVGLILLGGGGGGGGGCWRREGGGRVDGDGIGG